MQYYAHSLRNKPITTWQLLSNHAEAVSQLCSIFSQSFNSECFGKLLGLLHDLGKARSSFQAYLKKCNGIDDVNYDIGDHSHSSAGACWLNEKIKQFGPWLAYCVAGHHAGLPDYSKGVNPNGALTIRLNDDCKILEEPCVKDWICQHNALWQKINLTPPFKFSRDDSSVSFWIRMLYSCLVDADFLDTEAFMQPERNALRVSSDRCSFAELSASFFRKLDEKQNQSKPTLVNQIRSQIRLACETAAEKPQGLFSLTVPTGGGKTLSSTAFALRHLLKHGLKRIIYVIPYTSIIEQTADVLRDFFGSENVLEHHSNFDPEKETQQSRLASENWDAPIIVTTAVQFFESLYACRSSQCRKLHNITESVVILDEVQLLPIHLLLPCAEAIKQLTLHYKVSIVLSTATQLNLPGISSESVSEIIPSSLNLYTTLKRTEIEFPEDLKTRKSWDEIAEELSQFNQVLCIVNTRRDCYDLCNKMPEGTFHLSASMCGEHRSRVIAEIKQRLAKHEPIRVISTQLVEAGVDIDFPIVYRAFTGLSSIAQSAGRCNREGRLPQNGRVVVFMSPSEPKVKTLRDGEYAMCDLLARDNGVNPDDAKIYLDYFHALLSRSNDMGDQFALLLGVTVPSQFRNGISQRPDIGKYQFREAATQFQMIDGAQQVAVIVKYASNDNLINELYENGPKRDVMRKLQRYTVNIPRGLLTKFLESGMIEELKQWNKDEGIGIYIQTISSAYSEQFGFNLFRDGPTVDDFFA